MERINIFNQIHKGLRAALYETALFLQQADFSSPKEADAAIEKISEIVMLFEEHAGKEDNYVLPAIAAYEPSVVDCFAQEHAEDHMLGEALKHRLAEFLSLSNDQQKLRAGRMINQAFVAFLVFNLNHMAKEEDLINTLLWRYYTDEEILDIQQQIVKNTQPWHNDFFSKWMIRGINRPETVQWLKTVESNAPPVVYKTLYHKCKQELAPERFRKIESSLS